MQGMRDRIERYISKWESQGYSEGIPDEADSRLEALNKAPSYRAICRAIIRNDIALTSLGYSRPVCETYDAIKRLEIENRSSR